MLKDSFEIGGSSSLSLFCCSGCQLDIIQVVVNSCIVLGHLPSEITAIIFMPNTGPVRETGVTTGLVVKAVEPTGPVRSVRVTAGSIKKSQSNCRTHHRCWNNYRVSCGSWNSHRASHRSWSNHGACYRSWIDYTAHHRIWSNQSPLQELEQAQGLLQKLE